MNIQSSEYLSRFTGAEIDSAIEHMQNIELEFDEKVDKTQTINGIPLNGDITITAQDTGAVTPEELNGKVDKTQTINGKALSGNITLTAQDVGAATTSDIGNALITFTQGGDVKGTITANQTEPVTIDFEQGGGTGSSTLSGLEDVTLVNIEDGQILTYSTEENKWINQENTATSVVFVDWTT